MDIPTPDNERHVYLRVDGMEKLRLACDDQDTQAIIRIAFYTGLQVGCGRSCRGNPRHRARRPADLLITGRPERAPKWCRCIRDSRDLSGFPFGRDWRTYYARFEAARARRGWKGSTCMTSGTRWRRP